MAVTTVNLGKIRINWRGAWVTSTAYTINDAVSFGGSSYICVIAHTSGTWATDLAAVNWQIMSQGASANTNPGDITYYGASSNTRLPIGSAGQVLTVGTSGYPQWGNPNAEGSVYYVSDDTGSDTFNGTSLNAAFKTLRKACDTITGPATVYVKAGTYNEKLPITVPANVTIIGDGMRNTTITALVGSATATYTSSGSSGTTLKVSSTSGIAVGMTVTGTGFSSAQKITVVVDSTTLTISSAPDTTPSGTLTFRHLSTDASPVVNNLSTMFLLSDQTMLQGLLMTGMTGFASGSPANDITAATIGGVYLRLNPASPIANKSPYIKDCSAISAGGIGAIVDGSVHASGNKSMVFWAYNIVQDGGVGLWVLNGGRVEAVSVFTYYCYIGYVTTSGGQIRSLSGNNSYGTYGAISSGFLGSETPVTATVYGGMLTYNANTLTGSFQQGETITQATSGATGIVTSAQTGYLYYKSSSGTFNTTNVVTGGTSGATMTPSTVGGQSNYILVLSSASAVPQVGASIQFATGDTGAYVISAVSNATVNSVNVYIVTLAQQKVTASTDGTVANIRYNFSLIRLTGHDFLFIGTGGVATTNYPGIPSQGPTQANQIVYTFPGRVYYVATDEKGNFNVGQYFAVNQATGAATLNANAFNLSGLTSLRLGSIGAQLGAQVDEFSTDGTLSANSNTKVPTQAAMRTYLGSAYQHFKPVTDITYDLGDPTHRWRSIYVGPGSVTIGTVVLSDNAGSLTVSGTGPVTFGNTTITGNLTVNGTTTTVNSATLTVDDKNLELGSVATISGLTGTIVSSATTSIITGLSSTVGMIPGQALTKLSGTGIFGTSPLVTSIDSATQITITSSTANTLGSITFDVGGATDATANGGGITLLGATNKTIIWDSANTNWTASENLNIATGKTFKVNNVSVLSTSAVLASATGVTIGGTGTTTVGLGTNTTAANTVTVGGAITGNVLKIAGTTGGTVTLDSDVTSGIINVWGTATGGTINFGAGGSNSINLGGSGSTITVGGTSGNGTVSISGNSGSGTATITTNVTSGIVNLFAGVTGAINIGAIASTTTVKGTLSFAGSSSGTVKFIAPAAAGSATYTLPSADGTNGQALVTNGSGTLSWNSVAVTPTAVSSQANTATDFFALPSGTTGQRPGSPATGYVRNNSTLGCVEVYDGVSWVAIGDQRAPYAVEVLIVAGGGGGGLHSGGGGGAGGLLYYGAEAPKTPNGAAITVTGGSVNQVVVGGGGASSGGPYQTVNGAGYNGDNSSFGSYIALGGGGGGSGGNGVVGKSGGSGGGGGRQVAAGAGTTGQGFAGGFPNISGGQYPGGGGGGASAVGGAGGSSNGGTGANGYYYSISGTSTPYAGGGGGNLQDSANSVPTQGAGGVGGGGNGANTTTGNPGSPNTGGGGGGNNYTSNGGGAGGKGIVIVRYFGPQKGTGGTVSTSGGYTIHTFTDSGQFTG